MEKTNVYGLKFANSNYLPFPTTTQIKKEILQTLVIAKGVFEILRVAKLLFLFFGYRFWVYLIILLPLSQLSPTKQKFSSYNPIKASFLAVIHAPVPFLF